jgi:hypothetical protein
LDQAWKATKSITPVNRANSVFDGAIWPESFCGRRFLGRAQMVEDVINPALVMLGAAARLTLEQKRLLHALLLDSASLPLDHGNVSASRSDISGNLGHCAALEPATKSDCDELLDAKEAALTLRVSTSTLAKLRVAGGGPGYVKIGRRVFYRREDLINFLRGRRRFSTSEIPSTPVAFTASNAKGRALRTF